MRNATTKDVEEAKRTSLLKPNVMYNWMTDRKVHGASQRVCRTVFEMAFKQYEGTHALAETLEGTVILADLTSIWANAKGPAQQPKKAKRTPVKGNRPETLIPMSKDVKLEVGDTVLLSNGERDDITIVEHRDSTYRTFKNGWFNFDGLYYPGRGVTTITHKILPYQPPVVAEKSRAQKDFEAGYWVPFIADAQTSCPPWAVGVKINWSDSNGDVTDWDNKYAIIADHMGWTEHHKNAVVAYRKAKQ